MTYRICANCIMDTSDSGIVFDARGWCDYCNNYHRNILPNWHPDDTRRGADRAGLDRIRAGRQGPRSRLPDRHQRRRRQLVRDVSREGEARACVRCCSTSTPGGTPSRQSTTSRGWSTASDLDLHTEVVDWLEMKDLQLAFFKAQVPHLDTPQDHAFFAGLYNFAAKHGFKYILTGANYSTECVREPLEWHYHASDLRQLKDIHRRFGTRPLETFPLADIFTYKLYYRFVKGRAHRQAARITCRTSRSRRCRSSSDRFGWQSYRAQALRIAIHALLRRLLAADQVRLRQAPGALLQPDSHGADDARRGARAHRAAGLRRGHDGPGLRVRRDQARSQRRASCGRCMAGPNRSYRDYRNSMGLIDAGTQVLRALGLQRGDHPMITIVDYGLGNIRAFLNVYQPLEHRREARAQARRSFERRHADDPARRRVRSITRWSGCSDPACARRSTSWCSSERVPVLGVCVGMQMLARSQRRGDAAGPGLDRRHGQGLRRAGAGTEAAAPAHGLERRARRLGRQRLFEQLEPGCAVLFPAFLLLRLRCARTMPRRSRLWLGVRLRRARRAISTACSSIRRRVTMRNAAAEEFRSAVTC